MSKEKKKPTFSAYTDLLHGKGFQVTRGGHKIRATKLGVHIDWRAESREDLDELAYLVSEAWMHHQMLRPKIKVVKELLSEAREKLGIE